MNDFYYNFTEKKVLSLNDPSFFIQCFMHDDDPERRKPLRFVLGSGDFTISFLVSEKYEGTNFEEIKQSIAENGVMTVKIGVIGSYVFQRDYDIRDGERVVDTFEFVANKFNSVAQQTKILELFKKAMFAFPASFNIKLIGEINFELMGEKQKELSLEYEYGCRIEYSDELLKQIDSGALISR